jgi:hypothetical protein
MPEQATVSKEHAIKGAQEELSLLGAKGGLVVDVQRSGHDVLIILNDGKSITADGLVAVKLRKMLKRRYQSPWTPAKSG